MRGSTVAAFVAVAALTACSRTELAAQQSSATLTAQGKRITNSFSFTEPMGSFPSACTGEFATGPFTISGERAIVTDASGGVHVQIRYSISGTYTGTAGTTFTEANSGNFHVNLPSSGVVNTVNVLNGYITGDDGTVMSTKDRIVFVMDANGVTRVDRSNILTTALRCKKG